MAERKISREALTLARKYEEVFLVEFDFYLDALDEVYNYATSMGIARAIVDALPAEQQTSLASHHLFLNSAIATSTGALRLLSGNLYSDAFALIRIMYETASLMWYGNLSADTKTEVDRTMFHSGLVDLEQSKAESNLTRKARVALETSVPEMKPVINYLNNFGGHISFKKIIDGHNAISDQKVVTSGFVNNRRNRQFLMGLEFLLMFLTMIMEEHSKFVRTLDPSLVDQANEVMKLASGFQRTVRPRLIAMIDESIE